MKRITQNKGKLKGAALPMALGFSLLLILLTYIFLQRSMHFNDELIKSKRRSGILECMDDLNEKILETGSDSIYAGGFLLNDRDTITQQEGRWGIFRLIKLYSESFSDLSRAYIMTAQMPAGKGCIRSNDELILSGSPSIKGELFIQKGIKKIAIDGRPFKGDLSECVIKTGFPVGKEFRFNIPLVAGPDERFRKSKIQKCSFFEKTRHMRSEEDIVLDNCLYKGNIVIESERSISVNKTAILEDVILIANEIHIREQFKGNIQCLAKREINIEKNCRLDFPSALVISGKNSNRIKLGAHTIVNGDIIVADETQKANEPIKHERTGNKMSVHNSGTTSTPQIRLEAGATLNGTLYCDGILINDGEINGSFISRQVGSDKGSTVYMNHIGSGNFFMQDRHYCLINPNVFMDREYVVKKVGKWVS